MTNDDDAKAPTPTPRPHVWTTEELHALLSGDEEEGSEAGQPRVYNKKLPHPADAVYVGRPSPWGNPFGGPRAQAIQRYAEWLPTQPELVARAKRELRGKDLVCWCTPAACHADILLRLANAE